MDKRTFFFIIGFGLLGFGFYSLIMMMVGIGVQGLVWIDSWGELTGFLIRIAMVMIGGIFIALGATDWKREQAEIDRFLQEQNQSDQSVN